MISNDDDSKKESPLAVSEYSVSNITTIQVLGDKIEFWSNLAKFLIFFVFSEVLDCLSTTENPKSVYMMTREKERIDRVAQDKQQDETIIPIQLCRFGN